MLLTLEVISANGDVLGGNRRKTVGPEGAQIGRSKESDWVINDQYISRIHARVRYVNGAFYLEGLGRNPLALNDPEQTIPNNEPQLLRDGDRFFLDQYEIRASMSAGHAPAPLIGDPFASEPARSSPTVPQAWDAGIMDGEAEESGNLDPLAALGGPAPRKQAPLPPVNIHQGSVLEDSFRAPSPVSYASPAPVAPKPIIPTPAGAGGTIPDAWDRSGFTQMGQQPASPAPPPRRPAPAAPPPRTVASPTHSPVVGSLDDSSDDSIPDTWDKSRVTRIEQPPPVKAPPAMAPAQDPSFESAHQTVEKPRQPAPSQPSHTIRRPAEPIAPPPLRPSVEPATAAPLSSAGASAAGSLNLEELLHAAGVPATQMSPEMARELGQVLRIVVQGVMEVLQSRAEIKSQLRMSMTRMQASENNPLKFSPNVEAALHTLLVERNRGYLPTTRAFQEALTDIRNHQIAVLQGIRTAFDSMLEHFDPEKLEAEIERQSKRGGLLNLGGKGRFRDHYVEQFTNMTRDPDESFRRLFGEYFAQAYEEQMDRLKATAHTSGGQ